MVKNLTDKQESLQKNVVDVRFSLFCFEKASSCGCLQAGLSTFGVTTYGFMETKHFFLDFISN